jgi:hypothetical protein
MNYTVIFNLGSTDCEIMTDGHGFAEQFANFEDANNEAVDWLDDDQYKNFKVFAECSHDKNHLV